MYRVELEAVWGAFLTDIGAGRCFLADTCTKWDSKTSLALRLATVLKTIFHQCVISYTCSLSYSNGSVLNRAIRVRLATSI